jgi:hypothetical protein
VGYVGFKRERMQTMAVIWESAKYYAERLDDPYAWVIVWRQLSITNTESSRHALAPGLAVGVTTSNADQ